MTGDLSDFVSRLQSVLPKRWFADVTPNLNAIITSIATPWVWLYGLITYLISQTRVATATDNWLDLISLDFFGFSLVRNTSESDLSFRARIQAALLRSAATRAAITACMKTLTGSAPIIFEPARCGDTGSYATLANGPAACNSGLAYGALGGWGSLDLPFQFFVTLGRPPTPGLGTLAGYATDAGGYGQGSIAYVDLALLPDQVTNLEIETTLSGLLPVNSVAWLQIT
jgi:hypothetical protein